MKETMLQPVRPTSLLAFADALEHIGLRQRDVLRAIEELEPCNNLMISKHLNIPINSITPRCQELRKMGLVKEYKIDICPFTKRKTIFYVRVKK